jgi:5-methylcytosine-specific restriction endonuclease McrA
MRRLGGDMTSKSCIGCGQVKQLEMFHLHKKMKDGRLNKCRACIAEYNVKRNQDNPEIAQKKWAKERERLGITRTRDEFLREIKDGAVGRRASALKYARANKGRQAAWVRADRAANPEKYSERGRAYKQKVKELNPAKYLAAKLALEAKRRAAKLKRTPAWADQDVIAGMYELCAIFRSVGLDMTIDHIVPLQGRLACGFHSHDNLQLMHKSMNSSKGNKLIDNLTAY